MATFGLRPERTEVEADRSLRRKRGIEQTAAVYREISGEVRPPMRRLLDYAGLSPERAVLRWGNYDKILLLPSTVFSPDDSGRSYRLRPNQRSVWLKNVSLPRNLSGFFLVPDRLELAEVLRDTGAYVVPGSAQTTNSWGCRGPEPRLDAPIRGLVLGDSNMQGLFVADPDTPPERLARDLESRLGKTASILNTGHLGYSPEQFFHALVEYGDRFRPQFVVLTLCANDFGEVSDALQGRGDWEEGAYWLDRIYYYCRVRHILCVTSPVPCDSQIIALRQDRDYPGMIGRLSAISSIHYCFPIEALVDEHLRIRNDCHRKGETVPECPLFNHDIGDNHMSARGTAVWGRALGERVASLLVDFKDRGLINY